MTLAEANTPDIHAEPEAPSAAPIPAFSSHGREESASYGGIVARLNGRLRVINGRCGLQWILQVRKSATKWESIAFCGTKEGLFRRIKMHLQGRDEILPLEALVKRSCYPDAWRIIAALPEFYSKT